MSTCESGGDPYPLSSHSLDPNPSEPDHQLPPDPLLDPGAFIDCDLDSTGPTLTTTGFKEAPNGLSDHHQHGVREPVGDEPERLSRPATDASNCTETSATDSTPPRGRRGAPPQAVPVELLPERPKWLPESWVMDCRIRTSGASAGSIDRIHTMSTYHIHSLSYHSPNPMVEKKKPSLVCQDLPEFYPLAAHCKMPIFMDLNVIPKGGGMMLVKEEEAQNNETRTAKPTKNETQKLVHDELDLWKNLVAASLNCGDVLKMTVPMVETTTKPLPLQRWKRQPALTVLSVPLQKRPEWLPWGWWIDYRARSSGASAGLVDKLWSIYRIRFRTRLHCCVDGIGYYYFDPVSGRRFRSKKEVDYFLETGSTRKRKRDPDTNSLENSGGRKSSAPLNFEFNDVPENVRWVLTNASRDQWTPFVGDKMVPKSTRKEWNAAFHFSCS
ncbi:unnamed protein product [Camellia sinensis]